MNLYEVFEAIAVKILTTVDLPDRGSNQHELNGSAALRVFFQTNEAIKGTLHWFYFSDSSDPISSLGEFTFYDSRAKSAIRTGRTEWRMYYKGNFLSQASEEDVLVLARDKNEQVFALVFEQNSAWLQAAQILFAFAPPATEFQHLSQTTLTNQRLEYIQQRILEALGIDIVIPATESDQEIIVRKFGTSFPDTKKMSEFARSVAGIKALDDADAALVRWLQREEELFRALEEVIIREKLKAGFANVDVFISYSLTVQNRRKSRMGYALMHHLRALFDAYNLKYKREAKTERKNRPDFLFPGETEYHDPTYDTSLLVMLAAKSTLKERWRQVLTEADRITHKHVCTLEPAISRDQTYEMKEQKLTLVIPTILHVTYLPEQRSALMTLKQFIEHVKKTQKHLW